MWHRYFERRRNGELEPVVALGRAPVPERGADRWAIHVWMALALAAILAAWAVQ